MAVAWAFVAAMRPRQWIKNLLVFAGVVYAGQLTQFQVFLKVTLAFLLFCALSGVIYVINDIFDLEQDRHHPKKKLRPIASGRLPIRVAWVAAIIIGLTSLVLSFVVSKEFGFCALVYAVLMSAYSFGLKEIVILDILIVAIGFVLRAYAGTQAIHLAKITPWFLSCILFLALFIAICKRRHELLLLNEQAQHHRAVLRDYSPGFLDQMISATTAAALLSYTLWAVAETQPAFRGMILTVPFVVYGIFRYLFLVYHRSEGGAPEVMFLTDRSLLINTILWIAVVMILIYRHPLLEWLPIAGSL